MPPIDDSTHYREAQELFLDLLDATPAEREDALERRASTDPDLARRVASMLANDPGTELSDDASPRRFGPYEVVRPIARGGMGEVVVAKRIDGEYEREVAIKLLREDHASQSLVKRFLRERQTLARLDHEYIARLLDGGTTESGEPYLVMEYVEGEHADTYAAGLDVREKLELFVRICEAVQHAHEQGVVHRDLKPSNVLVRADGKPRLLDFGIARPDDESRVEHGDPLTRTGHRLFTPEFASPEQVRGETVTPMSDQFALGVLLYVFLAGESPWASADDLHELERMITTVDPWPPSRHIRGTTRRRLPKDLDAIVMQAIEKRPGRRYESVADLQGDVERHLAGVPVKARRTHTLERAGRFVVRNPLVPVAVLLLLFGGVAAFAAVRAADREEARKRDVAEAVRDRVNNAKELWYAGKLDEVDVELARAYEDVLDLTDAHALRAMVLAQMAIQAGVRKDWARSLELADEADAAISLSDPVDPEIVVSILNVRANAYYATTDGPESEEHSLAAMRYAHEHLPPDNALRVDAILGWSDELRRNGRINEALSLVDDVIEDVRAADPRHRVLGRFLNHRAVLLAENGRAAESIEEYRKVLEAISWHMGESNPAFGKVRLNLASALFRVGLRDDAIPEYEASLVNCRLNELSTHVAANAHFLARAHLQRGELEPAREYIGEAIEIRGVERPGMFHDRSRAVLALIDEADGRTDEAREVIEPLLASMEAGYLMLEVEADVRRAYAEMLLGDGERESALREFQRAKELCDEAPYVAPRLRERIESRLAEESEGR